MTLAETVAEALASLDDNDEFDHARDTLGFPESEYVKAVSALRALRDALN